MKTLPYNKLYEFWRLYDFYGINVALEWLETNKYHNDITELEINNLNNFLNNIKI